MTCGSSAARVEKALARAPGVLHVAVNLASEKATVAFDEATTSTKDLISAVERIGYGATPLALADVTSTAGAVAEPDAGSPWLARIAVGVPLGVAVLVLSMVWMHEPWARWSAMALTVPVQFWCGWPFLRQAAIRARARQASMDTLIAIGTLSAFLFSAYQVTFGHRHTDHYFDTAALIVVFLLAGRHFEARAKGRASGAMRGAARARRQGRPPSRRRRRAHGAGVRAGRRRCLRRSSRGEDRG